MTKNNVFSNKEMTIEFCHIQVTGGSRNSSGGGGGSGLEFFEWG